MAQGNQDARTAWSTAAALRKYGLRGGLPMVSSAFDSVGFIATMAEPSWFHHVPENERPFVAQALLSEAQDRVGQNSGAKTPAEYQTAINGALTSANGSDRVRDKDALLVAVKSEITAKSLAVKPDATDDEIAATVAANGEAYTTKHADRLVAEGFMVPKKTKRSEKPKAAAIAI